MPTNVTASLGNPPSSTFPEVRVNWLKSTDNVAVTSYTVLRDGVAFATVDATGSTGETFNDRSVSHSTFYTYAVRANDAGGNASTTSALASITTPGCSSCLSTLRPSGDVAKSGFTAKSGNTLYSQIREVAADSDVTYINGPFGKSGFATVSVGSALTGGTPTSIRVLWSAKRFYQSGTSGTATLQIELYNGPILIGRGLARSVGTAYATFTDTFSSLPGGWLNDLRVKIVQTTASAKTAGRVTWVAVILDEPPTDSTPPSVPTGLNGAPASDRQINLSWSPSTDNTGVHGYIVYRNGSRITALPVGSTTFKDVGVVASTTYQYRILAVDGRGNDSALSAATNVTTAAAPVPPADTSPPSVPLWGTAAVVGPTRVNLAWNASSDNVAVQGYLVIRNGVQVGTLPVGSTSFSDTGLVPSTVYHYQLRSIDGSGNISALSTTNTTGTPPGP